jgi:hypothetical protein
VRIARNGSRWTTKKGIELTGEMRPWGRRSSSRPVAGFVSVEMGDRPDRAGAECGSGGVRGGARGAGPTSSSPRAH